MNLPNAEKALLDTRKISGYCLNPEHPRGKHKARVFASALGLSQDDTEILGKALLDAAQTVDATQGETDEFGVRYVLDFTMTTEVGSAVIRSAWIIRPDEDFPRFVSAYVNSGESDDE